MMRKEKFQPFDEEFAAAADDFLDGNIVRTDREDTELSVLLDTLERVDEAFDYSAEAEARERIRGDLRKVWFEMEAEKAAQQPGVLSQIRDFFWRNQRQARFAVSLAMILLILVAAPAFFGTEPNLMGAAGEWTSSPVFVVVLLVGLVSTLFLVLKRPKK